ncbi:amidase family protein [Bacillus licheniformis]|nr:amidase family protein [Bacillus licheniformis]
MCHGQIPGGSSSGSAVAAASGMTDFALGTDTGDLSESLLHTAEFRVSADARRGVG